MFQSTVPRGIGIIRLANFHSTCQALFHSARGVPVGAQPRFEKLSIHSLFCCLFAGGGEEDFDMFQMTDNYATDTIGISAFS